MSTGREAPLEMSRSVSQLLFSYLPNRTVSWEDGAGIVQLDTPRLESAWPPQRSEFVLREIGAYLDRWRARGVVDSRFPPTNKTDRYTVGTPRSISAHALETAFYCRRCFRFLPRLGSGKPKYHCPDCKLPTLRQLGYVFVHGCGELVSITDSIPFESKQQPGTIFNARIRCATCGDRAKLRLDARAERLSALRIVCDTCRGEVVGRPLARCPYCLPRLKVSDTTEQLAFRTAMRITRHSANNAYYPHAITILRLDRPRIVQATQQTSWLQSLLPKQERQGPLGVSLGLADLVTQLSEAEAGNDMVRVADLKAQIAAAVSGPSPSAAPTNRAGVLIPEDVIKNVRESIALLSTVRRTDARRLFATRPSSPDNHETTVGGAMGRLGIRAIEYAEDIPVVSAVFGYSRRSPDPDYQEGKASQRFPTTLRPFPNLDDAAARAVARPQAVGTVPVLAREGTHEGLAFYLDPKAVIAWLAASGIRTSGSTEEEAITNLLSRLEPVERYYDDIWEKPIRRAVFGLLHSFSHSAMRAIGRIAGLEETSVGEYLFLPLLCTVVYSSSGSQLGGIRTTARDRMLELLETIEEEATRCLYDPDCIEREGACHGCIQVPELGCRVFNHGLSRALLVGGHAPWATSADRSRVQGFWTHLASGKR